MKIPRLQSASAASRTCSRAFSSVSGPVGLRELRDVYLAVLFQPDGDEPRLQQERGLTSGRWRDVADDRVSRTSVAKVLTVMPSRTPAGPHLVPASRGPHSRDNDSPGGDSAPRRDRIPGLGLRPIVGSQVSSAL